MFWFLRRSSKPAKRPNRTPLEIVRLEDRVTPTLYTGFAPHINTTTPLDQFDVASATSQAGMRVAVWTHQASATNLDIRGQRYTRLGAMIGPEFTVAGSALNETAADVAIDAGNRFYVAYVRQTTSTNRDVVVARYSSTGAFLGTTTVANSVKNEYDPSIAVSPSSSSFIVSYTLDFTPTNQDVQARIYTFSGTLVGVVPVATLLSNEAKSDVARVQSTGGSTAFAIVYAVNDQNVYLKRYNAAGGFLSAHAIANSPSFETNPSVSANAIGNYAVAWQAYVGASWNIYASVVIPSIWGPVVSAPALVQGAATQNIDPSIGLKNDNDFVVAYRTAIAPRAYNVYVTEMNFANQFAATVRATYLVATNGFYRGKPALAIESAGYYTIAHDLYNMGSDPQFGIFGRLGYLA